MHACALKADGYVVCWGNNGDGQATPPAVAAIPGQDPMCLVHPIGCGATVALSATPSDGSAPLAVQLEASLVTDLGINTDSITYQWSASDGQTAAGQTAAMTFTTSGTYVITVTATDPHSYTSTAQTTVTVTAAPPQSGPVKISAFGDSITFGVNNCIAYWPNVPPTCTENNEETPPSYRYPLWDKMQAAGWNVDFVGHDTSTHPWNFDQDVDAIPTKTIGELYGYTSGWSVPPDIALVYLGAQNIFDGYPTAESMNEMSGLIDRLRESNPDMIIFLGQLYPMSSMPGMPPLERWQAFNAELAALAQSKNTARSPLIVVDHFTGFNEASDLINDRVHPNAAGEEKIAQRWFEAMNASPAVQALLGSDAQAGGYPLTVTASGCGMVSSTPAGIDCGEDCSATYPAGTQITLSASPLAGCTFRGWGGDCPEDVINPALPRDEFMLTLDRAKTCTATFSGTFTPPAEDPICLVQPIRCGATVTATATPASGPGPLPVRLEAALVRDLGTNADSITYTWHSSDGTATGRVASLTFTAPGKHFVTVTATDPGGHTATAQTSVTVDHTAAVNAFPQQGEAPLTVDFYAESSLPSCLMSPCIPVDYYWDFGDGTSSTEDTPEHVYTLPGTYTVTVTAQGVGSAEAQTTVTVVPAQSQGATRFVMPEAVYAGTTRVPFVFSSGEPLVSGYPAEVYIGQRGSALQQYAAIALRGTGGFLFHNALDNSIVLIDWDQKSPLLINGIQTSAGKIARMAPDTSSAAQIAALNNQIDSLGSQLAEKNAALAGLSGEIDRLKDENAVLSGEHAYLLGQLIDTTPANDTAACPSLARTVDYTVTAGTDASMELDAQTSMHNVEYVLATFWQNAAAQCSGQMPVKFSYARGGISTMLELPADAADLAEVAEMYMGLGVNYTGSGGTACKEI